MKKPSRIGLFFGSFNPIHNGHMMIASYMVEFTDLDQVWFVVSPHNPLKEESSLLDGHHRLAMVELAIGEDLRFRASGVEFKLPKPSYTIDTLQCLAEKYPSLDFTPIIGSDQISTFKKWKDWEVLLNQYRFYVYPRLDEDAGKQDGHPSFIGIPAPLITISSSFIRASIKNGKNMQYFLPDKVFRYIMDMHFYT